MPDYHAELAAMGEQARAAARRLAVMTTAEKNACLEAIAVELLARADDILAANAKDLEAGAANGLSAALMDRLRLDEQRLRQVADGLREVAALPDPVGTVDREWTLYNGVRARKVRVPLGVVGIIYESRPNVTVDAAGLCLKAGNPVLLRGGSESIHSNLALAAAMAAGGRRAGLPEAAVQLLPWTDRQAVTAMLRLDRYLAVIIPRGGEGLIRFVTENATVPVIKHYKGVCHVYVDRAADLDMAMSIIEDAKCQRPGVCNAAETLLIHREIAAAFAPRVAARLRELGVELRGDEAFRALAPEAKPATEDDWYEEYLDLILAVRIVPDIDTAIEHIATYGSAHSDAIVSADPAACERFLREVDSCAVYANASTRFTDGGEFGMGAEIGISTDRIHARGPMALPELTTYKYVLEGTGQVRG